MRRLLLVPVFVAVTALTSGCATQIIEAELTTTTSDAPRPDPTGNVGELLDQLLQSFGKMSDALAQGDRTSAREELDYVKRTWTALEPQITDRGEQYVKDVRRVVDLAVSSVERNRPADAGKALRFIELVIAAQTS